MLFAAWCGWDVGRGGKWGGGDVCGWRAWCLGTQNRRRARTLLGGWLGEGRSWDEVLGMLACGPKCTRTGASTQPTHVLLSLSVPRQAASTFGVAGRFFWGPLCFPSSRSTNLSPTQRVSAPQGPPRTTRTFRSTHARMALSFYGTSSSAPGLPSPMPRWINPCLLP